MPRQRALIVALTAVAGVALATGALAQGESPSGALGNRGISNVYVFESQEDSDRLVFAMTLDAVALSGEQPTFNPETLYEFKVDSNNDYVEDKVVQITFTGTGQHQQVVVRGPAAPEKTGGASLVIPGDTLTGNVSLESSPLILSRTGYPVRAFAGLRDNPATADSSNVLAIVVEVRKDAVVAEGTPVINVWATTSTVGGKP